MRPAELLAEFGPVLGKGDAMWRALSVLTGDLIAFVDADSEDFGAHFACGLLGPLVCEPGVQFVKGFYRRPFKTNGAVQPTGGGRVTELTARPLLAAFYPELAGVRQPLAGEIAARRDLLERQVVLHRLRRRDGAAARRVRRDRDRRASPRSTSTRARTATSRSKTSTPMAAAVLSTVMTRLQRAGRLGHAASDDAPPERPPLAELRALGSVG